MRKWKAIVKTMEKMFEMYGKIVNVLGGVNILSCLLVIFFIMSYMSFWKRKTWVIYRSLGIGGVVAIILNITKGIWYGVLNSIVSLIQSLPAEGEVIVIVAVTLIVIIKSYQKLSAKYYGEILRGV